MKNYYCLFTIGPVQSFIAASRKTIDLIGGSRLLVHLAQTALEAFRTGDGETEIYFPVVDSEGRSPAAGHGIPNRFFGKVNADGPESVSELLRACEHRVREELQKWGHEALADLPGSWEWAPPGLRQLEHFIEIYWAFRAASEAGYGADYGALESLLGRRKALRDFAGYEEPPRERCSLLPDYSILAPGNGEGRAGGRRFWREMARRRPIYFSPKEQLSVIAVTKRYYGHTVDRQVPSVIEIANRPAIDAVQTRPGIKTVWEGYISPIKGRLPTAITDGRFPEWDFLYPETIDQLRGEDNEYGITIDRSQREMWITNLKRVHRALRRSGVAPAQKYYGILYFDGDRMGKHLSGAIGGPITEGRHREISVTLHRFTQEVASLVSESGGYLVYSGGDDVLAFVPLPNVLPLANRVRRAFAAAFPGSGFTGSAGIAVVHIRHNLKQALADARRAERFAKEVVGRNGFAVNLLRRSGSATLMGARWEHEDLELVALMETVTEDFRSRFLSPSIIYDLKTVADVFPSAALSAEIERLWGRHTDSKRAPEREKDNSHDLLLRIAAVENGRAVVVEEEKPDNGTTPATELIRLLEVCEFIARGGKS
jgi:CRISPR-associated protein Cmr2